MLKQQRIHDYLIKSALVTADHLSVYTDHGKIEWGFDADRQSFGLQYTANILVREYAKAPHLLFLCLVSGLAEIDPNPAEPHDLKWETSVLNNSVVDIEITVQLSEYYEYRDAEEGETADAMLGEVPVVLIAEEVPPLADFLRFALIMNHDHHL